MFDDVKNRIVKDIVILSGDHLCALCPAPQTRLRFMTKCMLETVPHGFIWPNLLYVNKLSMPLDSLDNLTKVRWATS